MSAPAVFRPARLDEAIRIRAAEDAIPFAGGTDLMVRLRGCAGALPAFDRPVLFLDLCPELRGIRELPDGVEIGSMTTLAELASSARVHPGLREAVRQMGGPALRTVATIGGNICNASPAADTLPFLYAFDASVILAGRGRERTIPVREFISGPGRTVLGRTEILRAVVVPAWPPALWTWRKVGTRRANALTKVSLAACASFDRGRISRARIALGAVAPTVVRVEPLETLLETRSTKEARAACAAAVVAAVRPIDDQRSTAEYRCEVAVGLVASFIGITGER